MYIIVVVIVVITYSTPRINLFSVYCCHPFPLSLLSRTMLPSLISTHVTKPILINLRQASSSSSSIMNRERLFDMLDQLFPSSSSSPSSSLSPSAAVVDQRLYSESIAEETFLLPWWRAPPSASDSSFERLSRLAYQICYACLQPEIWPPILSKE